MFQPSPLKQKGTIQTALAMVILSGASLLLVACAGAVPRDVEVGARLILAAATLQNDEATGPALASADPPVSPARTPTAAPVAEPVEPVEPVEFPETFTAFQDPAGRFRLDLPDGWTIEPGEASVLASSPSGLASMAVVGLPGETIFDEAGLNAHGASFLQGFFEDSQVTINSANSKADGSIFFDFTLTDAEGAVIEGGMYTEQRGLDLYQLLMLADAEQWSTYFDTVFRPVINSYFVTSLDSAEYLSGALPLTEYSDPDDLFTISLPVDWAGDFDQGYANVGVPERRIGITSQVVEGDLAEVGVEATAATILEQLYDQDFTIQEIEQADGGSYSITYNATLDGIDLRGFLYALQGNAYVYTLLFEAPERDWYGLLDTYGEVLATYQINPPEIVEAPNPFQPEDGRARLYVFNEYREELTFTINNQEIKVPPEGIEKPISIELDAGDYTFTISVPSGSANGEVQLGIDQSWAVGVRGDGAVYNPFQVFP